jgi:hypothetical protein
MNPLRALLGCLPIALALVAGDAMAQASDPPARVGSLTALEGSVVLAPAGETQWSEAPANRPVTAGDRLWTDPAGRVDVHLGTALLHVDSESFVEVKLLDDVLLQAVLHEGVVQARVRTLAPGELFEIDTPQLALRAMQPGTYRIDADPLRHITRVAVREGVATVSGRGGRLLTLYPGQQLEVAGAELQQVASVSFAEDAFDRWAAGRNAREDRSPAGRFLPSGVVGASQLDTFGRWLDDPAYGTVWLPAGMPADWVPYRYGRWQWIKPWGWTWIDDAPWGFAPFHYGRWALVGSRWAWVPGALGTRPVYAPALVAFVAGNAAGALPVGAGTEIAWYPLAPGEAWQPFFAASARFVRRANEQAIATAARIEHRADAITTVHIEDFRSAEPVQRAWRRARPADSARAQAPAPAAAPLGTRLERGGPGSRWQLPREP